MYSFGFVHPLQHRSSQNGAAPTSLTRGTGCFIFLFFLLLVVVLPAGFSAGLPVAVGVLGLQDIDGGRAGPAGVVGQPSPPAPTGALRRRLDALRRQGGRKLLRALLNTKQHSLQQANPAVVPLVGEHLLLAA